MLLLLGLLKQIQGLGPLLPLPKSETGPPMRSTFACPCCGRLFHAFMESGRYHTVAAHGVELQGLALPAAPASPVSPAAPAPAVRALPASPAKAAVVERPSPASGGFF